MNIERDMANRQLRQIRRDIEERRESSWEAFEQQQAEARAVADFNPTLFQDRLTGGLRFANWNDLRSAL